MATAGETYANDFYPLPDDRRFVLASCGTTATTIVTRQRLDKDAAGKLAYERIAVRSSVHQFTQGDLDQLKGAVLERLRQPVNGGEPVTLQLTVSDYSTGGSKMIEKYVS